MNPTLRELEAADWAVLKAIRLEALTLHPDLFSPSRDEFAFTDQTMRPGGAVMCVGAVTHNR